jgi:hypothetical protein
MEDLLQELITKQEERISFLEEHLDLLTAEHDTVSDEFEMKNDETKKLVAEFNTLDVADPRYSAMWNTIYEGQQINKGLFWKVDTITEKMSSVRQELIHQRESILANMELLKFINVDKLLSRLDASDEE